MTMETKHEVIRDVLEEYLKATRKEKGVILDRLEQTVHIHILPSGDTGFYWANGILIGSTLR